MAGSVPYAQTGGPSAATEALAVNKEINTITVTSGDMLLLFCPLLHDIAGYHCFESVRAVFLDRDGVINQAVVRNGKPYPPAGPDHVKLVANAAESLKQLKERDFRLVVVTNQPDVRRGTTAKQTVEQIHAVLAGQLPIDDFF